MSVDPFDLPSSMCEVRHTPRDVFDTISSCFAGHHFTAGSPKRSSYIAERTQASLLTRFTGSNLIYSSLALDDGSLK